MQRSRGPPEYCTHKTQEQNNHYGPTKVGRLKARKEKEL